MVFETNEVVPVKMKPSEYKLLMKLIAADQKKIPGYEEKKKRNNPWWRRPKPKESEKSEGTLNGC